jgi:hypothetical protein
MGLITGSKSSKTSMRPLYAAQDVMKGIVTEKKQEN